MEINDIAIIGGDMRGVYLYKLMKRKRLRVSAFGFDGFDGEAIESRKPFARAIERAQIVIGATPLMSGAEFINAPYSKTMIEISRVMRHMGNGQMFIAGAVRPDIKWRFKDLGIQAFDILEREEFAAANAVPTAEGAVAVAIQHMPTTLCGCNAMVMGAGRIGTALTRLLPAFGTHVTVAARNAADRARAFGMGAASTDFEGIEKVLRRTDVIFNTVPSVVLDREVLKSVKRGALYIELASKPFGVDADAARELGINVVWAPSLPGKVAPMSAAGYAFDAITSIVREVESCQN